MSYYQFNKILEQDDKLSKLLAPPPLSSILPQNSSTGTSVNRSGSAKPAFMNHMKSDAVLPHNTKISTNSLKPPSTTKGLGRGVRYMSTLETVSTLRPGSVSSASVADVKEVASERLMLRENAIVENPVKDKTYIYEQYDFSKHDQSVIGLPIYNFRDHLLRAIEMNQIIIVQGSTGCGKSTQLPQFIIDHCVMKDLPVNIIVTQPRRIAAMSLAERVCQERGWALGTVVGYQVGLNRNIGDDTVLSYVTTGVLLERLIQKTCNLREYSHIILDEIHERDVDMDLLMLIVKELLLDNPSTKLILMSATIAAQRIASYFAQSNADTVINIDGAIHTVEEFYLEDLVDKGLLDSMECFLDDSPSEMPIITTEKKQLVVDILLAITEEEQIYQGTDTLSEIDFGSVLIFLPGLSDIQDLHDYMMGIQEPTINDQRFENFCDRRNHQRGNLKLSDVSARWQIIFLHSSLSHDHQRRVFADSLRGLRKIILSTNIAESSITVAGIKYVIDFCMTKRLRYNRETKFSSLRPEWASQSNLIQRKGRAGRTLDGQVYRLIRREMFDELEEFCPPEMLTGPLEQSVLRTKEFGREPTTFLNRAIDPPNIEDIGHTLVTLKETGALTVRRENSTTAVLATSHWEGELTFIGKVMSALPVDIHVGKLVALGHIFNVLNESIILGACMSVNKSIFVSPIQGSKTDIGGRLQRTNMNEIYNKFLPSYQKKLKFAAGMHSDQIAMMNAYKLYHQAVISGRLIDKKKWCANNHLDHRAMAEVDELYREIKRRLEMKLNMHIAPRETKNAEFDLFLLKFIIAGAFYPHYFVRDYKSTAEEESTRMFGSKDPMRCVQLGNLPMGEGHFYLRQIQNHFKQHCMPDSPGQPQVTARDSKIVVEFPELRLLKHESDDANFESQYIDALPVYMALKMRQIPQLRPSLCRVRLAPELNRALNDMIDQHRHSTEIITKKHCSQSIKSSRHVGYPATHVEWVSIFPKFLIECGTFYGIYEEYADKEVELGHLITDYLKRDDQRIVMKNPRPGKLCLAPDTDLSNGITDFYRAKIKADDKDKAIALVFFVDFGSTGWVPFTSLLEMPKHIDEFSPHLAVEFVLSEMKPPANEHWSRHHLDVMENFFNNEPVNPWVAQVYSVVNNKVRIRLHFPTRDTNKITMNEFLVKEGVADYCEEPFTSRQDHANRMIAIRSFQNSEKKAGLDHLVKSGNSDHYWADESLMIEDFLRQYTNRAHSRDRIKLTGPVHPYEMTFWGLSRSASGKRVRIAPESVNHIVIDHEPQNPHQRLLVAGMVQSSPHTEDDLIIRHTTLLPHIPGLPFFVSMVFAPVAECRSDNLETRYTGAICGLGYDTNLHPINPSNDVEVMCDVRVDTDDLLLINDIRMLMSKLLEELREGAFVENQKNLRTLIQRYITEAKRKSLTNIYEFYPKRPYHWLQFNPDSLMLPDEEYGFHKRIPFIKHCGLSGVGYGYFQIFHCMNPIFPNHDAQAYNNWKKRFAQYMVDNHSTLERRLNSSTDTNLGQFVVCEACSSENKKKGVVLYNRINLHEHIQSMEHQNNVKFFKLVLKNVIK